MVALGGEAVAESVSVPGGHRGSTFSGGEVLEALLALQAARDVLVAPEAA